MSNIYVKAMKPGTSRGVVKALRSQIEQMGPRTLHMPGSGQMIPEAVGKVERSAELMRGGASPAERDGRCAFDGLSRPVPMGRHHRRCIASPSVDFTLDVGLGSTPMPSSRLDFCSKWLERSNG